MSFKDGWSRWFGFQIDKWNKGLLSLSIQIHFKNPNLCLNANVKLFYLLVISPRFQQHFDFESTTRLEAINQIAVQVSLAIRGG